MSSLEKGKSPRRRTTKNNISLRGQPWPEEDVCMWPWTSLHCFSVTSLKAEQPVWFVCLFLHHLRFKYHILIWHLKSESLTHSTPYFSNKNNGLWGKPIFPRLKQGWRKTNSCAQLRLETLMLMQTKIRSY